MAPEETTSRPTWTLRIGEDVCVRLTDAFKAYPPEQEDFLSPSGEFPCQLSLDVLREPIPDLGPLEPVFDSTSLWKVARRDTLHVFDLPHLRAVIDFETGTGRVFLPEGNGPAFDYPLDEVVFSKLLADHGWVIVHACGVAHRDRGLLLAGSSGAGKSTLAGLFAADPHARVLGDDRIALGIRDGRIRIAGTPWHGTAGMALHETVPLERIFLLRHAAENRCEQLPPAEAALGLLAQCVIPYWHRASAERAMDVVMECVLQRGVHELGFFPDAGVVGYLTGISNSAPPG